MYIYLAPILGHTDYVFRNALSRYFPGIDYFVTPFLTTVKGSYVKNSHLTDILPKFNKVPVVIPQILGKDPQEFLVLANQVFELGYKTVNWNLGCPYPMVVNKKRGAGLLQYPEMIKALLDSVLPLLKGQLSIKMRLGKIETDEIYPILDMFNSYSLENITIHPRTAKQMYSGTPDLVAFGKCLEFSKHTIIYNGDIVDCDSFNSIRSQFPTIQSFMIGRGLAMNPCLAEMIKNNLKEKPDDFFKRLYRFHEEILRTCRDNFNGHVALLGRMKQLWWYLSNSIPKGEETLLKIQRAKTLETYRSIIDEIFEDCS